MADASMETTSSPETKICFTMENDLKYPMQSFLEEFIDKEGTNVIMARKRKQLNKTKQRAQVGYDKNMEK